MKNLFQNKYRIDSTRLKGWDYSSNGYYFITLCAYQRKCLFGAIFNEKMILNNVGKVVEKYWLEIPNHFGNIKLDKFVVMPNHVHGIIVIDKDVDNLSFNKQKLYNVETSIYRVSNPCVKKDAMNRVSTNCINSNKGGITGKHNPMFKLSIPKIIRWYKGRCSFELNNKTVTPNNPPFTWQPSFYDHIIKKEKELNNIRQYIYANPIRWAIDRNNPRNLK